MVQRSEAKGDIYSTPDRRRRCGLRRGTVALQGGRRITNLARKWRCRRMCRVIPAAPLTSLGDGWFGRYENYATAPISVGRSHERAHLHVT